MIGSIVGGIIALVIASLLAAFVLQLATKIVCQQAVDYGEAFRTSLIALVVTRVADLGLESAGVDQWFVSPLLALIVWGNHVFNKREPQPQAPRKAVFTAAERAELNQLSRMLDHAPNAAARAAIIAEHSS